MITLNIEKELTRKSNIFSEDVTEARSVRNYLRGDNGSNRKFHEEIGKLGEVGAWMLVGGEIDWTIRKNKEIDFDPDLGIIRGWRTHVKTCSFDERDKTNSWLIARADPLSFAPAPNDKIVLCYSDIKNGIVDVLGSIDGVELCELNVWKPCYSPKVNNNKKAFYYKHIKHLVKEFREPFTLWDNFQV